MEESGSKGWFASGRRINRNDKVSISKYMYTVMDRSLGHPHSMGQGAFLASTTANVPIFWVEYINITALNLHRKPHKITSKGSWVIWERVYFGAQNNFLECFPRLLCIADGINLIFKCRIQWKALDTLNICKKFDGNWARFHEDMEKTVKSALRRPPWRPKFGNCIPSLQYFSSAQFESRPIGFRICKMSQLYASMLKVKRNQRI